MQELANIPVSEFPVVGPNDKVNFEPFYTVMGFAGTKYGLAILGRASQKQVVNVAQRGGICVVMTGRAPSRLRGPQGSQYRGICVQVLSDAPPKTRNPCNK